MKLTAFLLIIMVVLPLRAVLAEDLTLTTYYPAPEGEYRVFETTSDTRLATTDGSVTVGAQPRGNVPPSKFRVAAPNTGGTANLLLAQSTDGGGFGSTKFYVRDDGQVGVDDIYLHNPHFGSPRWASDNQQSGPGPGSICGGWLAFEGTSKSACRVDLWGCATGFYSFPEGRTGACPAGYTARRTTIKDVAGNIGKCSGDYICVKD